MRHADINVDLRLRFTMLVETLQGDVPAFIGLGVGLRF
jgi:hypothetical protein